MPRCTMSTECWSCLRKSRLTPVSVFALAPLVAVFFGTALLWSIASFSYSRIHQWQACAVHIAKERTIVRAASAEPTAAADQALGRKASQDIPSVTKPEDAPPAQDVVYQTSDDTQGSMGGKDQASQPTSSELPSIKGSSAAATPPDPVIGPVTALPRDDHAEVHDTDEVEGGYEYAFKLLPPASLVYSDVEHCPGAEPAAETLKPLHPGVNMLMVLGAQKGGTTWLASVLKQHPALETASHAYKERSNRETKEVHYLDWWPHFNGSEAWYLGAYPQPKVQDAIAHATQQLEAAGVPLQTLQRPAGVRYAYGHLTHDVAFFDATPNYLPIAHVAPRAGQIMPHARLVVVLRDPVARTLSAYNMDRGRMCGPGAHPFYAVHSQVCTDTSFADTVKFFTGIDTRGASCAFDGLDGGEPQTWHDCFRCWQMYFNATHCASLPQPRPFDGCRPRPLNYIHLSTYAPQLAWWLAFFPPEQLLILTSADLHDPDRQVDTLNQILDHAQLPNARRYTREWLDSMAANGFHGKYEEEDTAVGIPEAIAMLREHFRRPMEDLRHLVNRFWPHVNFTGLAEEV